MSRRTSESNKAIREAWKNEKSLVQRGQGTRDWTPSQQRDILEKGKAYDENGKAFEGHHMKSAEAYPEYQGDPQNIQFLSRDEHQDAHFGSFQNPTNGYYNPKTGETKDFGEGKYEPCEVNSLSEPVAEIDNREDKGEALVEENAEQEEQASNLTESADESPAEENTEQEEQASDLTESADESPAEENTEQEEQASDLTESADESPAEENTEQEEQASDLTESADETPAEENTEQEEQASDLTESADESPAEENTEQEEQSSDLTESADETSAEENTEQEEQASDLSGEEATDESGSEGESSEEEQSYSY